MLLLGLLLDLLGCLDALLMGDLLLLGGGDAWAGVRGLRLLVLFFRVFRVFDAVPSTCWRREASAVGGGEGSFDGFVVLVGVLFEGFPSFAQGVVVFVVVFVGVFLGVLLGVFLRHCGG